MHFILNKNKIDKENIFQQSHTNLKFQEINNIIKTFLMEHNALYFHPLIFHAY